ncbi:hypothetical protein N0V88_000493 [Collariella sp. IMI 366227]|nr:hypothetical protein N0V88_000493 [Collariella sp. IMI 366227]
MPFSVLLVLRITQGLFAAMVLVLSAFVANWYRTSTTIPSPSEINFLLFTACWSSLSLLGIEVLIPRFLPRSKLFSTLFALPFALPDLFTHSTL